MFIKGTKSQLKDTVTYPVEEIPVVGDHQKGDMRLLQVFLQPFNHVNIEVVCWLIKQEQIRFIEQIDKTRKSLPKKRSYKEQKEYELLEQEIASLEQEKSRLELELNSASEDYQKLEQCSKRIEEVIGLIDEKSFRWLELDELG